MSLVHLLGQSVIIFVKNCCRYRPDLSVYVFGGPFFIINRQEPFDSDIKKFFILLKIGLDQIPVGIRDLGKLTTIEVLINQFPVRVAYIDRTSGGQRKDI